MKEPFGYEKDPLRDRAVETAEPELAGCNPHDCDGVMHTCWNCGGQGAEHDGEDFPVTCHVCEGGGGWPCPEWLATQGEQQ